MDYSLHIPSVLPLLLLQLLLESSLWRFCVYIYNRDVSRERKLWYIDQIIIVLQPGRIDFCPSLWSIQPILRFQEEVNAVIGRKEFDSRSGLIGIQLFDR